MSYELIPVVENLYFFKQIAEVVILQEDKNKQGNLVAKLILKNHFESKDEVLHLLKQNIKLTSLRVESNVLFFLSNQFDKLKLKFNADVLPILPFQEWYGLYKTYIADETDIPIMVNSLHLSFAKGITLEKFVESFQQLIHKNPNIILKIIRQLIKQIKIIHDIHIIHRDLKPQNLIVNYHTDNKNNIIIDEVTLIDFGLATLVKKIPFTESLMIYLNTNAGFGGTIIYMTPENLHARFSGKRAKKIIPDKYTDIWGISRIYYYCFEKKPDFSSIFSEKDYKSQIDSWIGSLTRVNIKGINVGVQKLMKKAIQADHTDRPVINRMYEVFEKIKIK